MLKVASTNKAMGNPFQSNKRDYQIDYIYGKSLNGSLTEIKVY